MMYESNEQGRCPYCNEYALEYGAAEFEGDMMYFPWTCEQCHHSGEEWYDLTFVGHNDEEGNSIEVKEEE